MRKEDYNREWIIWPDGNEWRCGRVDYLAGMEVIKYSKDKPPMDKIIKVREVTQDMEECLHIETLVKYINTLEHRLQKLEAVLKAGEELLIPPNQNLTTSENVKIAERTLKNLREAIAAAKSEGKE